MTAPLLIGVTGKKRAGKDSFAASLVARHGFVRVAFADPLKAAAYHLDPMIVPTPDEDFSPLRLRTVVDRYGWERAKEYGEVRRVLQEFGVGIRQVDEHFWVRAGLRVATALLDEGQSVVITDVRFPNEAEAVQERDGTVVRVVRPGTGGDLHASETALDGFEPDFEIDNRGTLADLYDAADTVIRTIITDR